MMVGANVQEALRAITSDSAARRELLWLGAMEQEDTLEARRLESRQHGLSERMQKLVAERLGRCHVEVAASGASGGPPDDPPESLQEAYARIFNERWAFHATRLTGKPWKQRW